MLPPLGYVLLLSSVSYPVSPRRKEARILPTHLRKFLRRSPVRLHALLEHPKPKVQEQELRGITSGQSRNRHGQARRDGATGRKEKEHDATRRGGAG